MKIFAKDKVYVQRSDIDFLVNIMKIDIPSSIYTKTYGEGIRLIDSSISDTFIEFTEPDEIKFFKDDKIILNYEEVRSSSVCDVELKIAISSSTLTDLYNADQELFLKDVNTDEFRDKVKEIEEGINKTNFRITSLSIYRSYLKRKRKINFPEEVPTRRNCITKVLRTIFKRDKNQDKAS